MNFFIAIDSKITLLFGQSWTHFRGFLPSVGSFDSFPFLAPVIELFNTNCRHFSNSLSKYNFSKKLHLVTSILSLALFTQIRVHVDEPIEENSAIQSLELYSASQYGNAIFLPQ